MSDNDSKILKFDRQLQMADSTLVLAFSGWMDGGDVSTGTVMRLVDLLEAESVAELDPEPFYIYNVPGPMEVAEIFRPHIEIDNGLIQSLEMPTNTFYCHEEGKLCLFVGKEPHMHWRGFGEAIFDFVRTVGVSRILFVGSFGGAVPHTREPRLYVTCSDAESLEEMEKYGVRRSGYQGPGSFTSYLMTQASREHLKMTSLVAEIPGYLHGTNPLSIAAVTRRLATILALSTDLDSLRTMATDWEMQVSSKVEEDEEMADKVRELEEQYDNELLDESS